MGGSGVQVTWPEVEGRAARSSTSARRPSPWASTGVEFNGDSLTVSYPDIDTRTFRTTTKMTTNSGGLTISRRLGCSPWRTSAAGTCRSCTIGNLNLLAATDAVNWYRRLWSATGSHDVDVSKDEMRDLALNNRSPSARCWSSAGT